MFVGAMIYILFGSDLDDTFMLIRKGDSRVATAHVIFTVAIAYIILTFEQGKSK